MDRSSGSVKQAVRPRGVPGLRGSASPELPERLTPTRPPSAMPSSMASYPHVIRLRGPWEFQPLARLIPGPDGALVETAAALPPAGRVTPPADWGSSLSPGFRGRVRYTRRFNRPTGLEPHERVWLVIDGVDACGSYALDGHPLGSIDGYALPAANDITDLLAQVVWWKLKCSSAKLANAPVANGSPAV